MEETFNFLVVAINDSSKTLYDILSECNYTVTVCETYSKAAETLSKKEQIFNIVVVGVNDPDDQTFAFLSCVTLGLPALVVSTDSSRKSVCSAMESGCCDYLSPEAFRLAANTMWQHAVCHVVRNPPRQRAVDADIIGEVLVQGDEVVDQPKKRRVVWSDELCNDFQEAVDQLGDEKAVPKKIWEIMIRKHPYLTRENIASHLQKCRELNKEQSATSNGSETRQIVAHNHLGDN